MIEDTSKEFIKRHIGPTSHEENTMVKKVGAQSLEDLIEKTVPQKILIKDNCKSIDIKLMNQCQKMML